MLKQYLTKKEMKYIKNIINNQKGQNYPCSNQIVLCGFFGDEEQFNKFCKDKTIIRVSDNGHLVYLNNGEKWLWVEKPNDYFRGYRYYKCKISKTIDRQKVEQIILPCCIMYCTELEWI